MIIKAIKTYFAVCVCLNFHPISFSIHVIRASERTFVRTRKRARTHACPFVVCFDIQSPFRPLFIWLPKYNENTFTMFSFDMVLCLHIYIFRAS